MSMVLYQTLEIITKVNKEDFLSDMGYMHDLTKTYADTSIVTYNTIHIECSGC